MFQSSYVNHIRGLLDDGVPVEAISCHGHLGPEPQDLGRIETSLNTYWQEFGLPIWITEWEWKNQDEDDHTQHAEELDNFYRLAMR